MQHLSLRIKEEISKHDLSVHNLEKKAGLKTGAIQNIIYGRSKNPSISLVKSIAQALNCSIESLLKTENTYSEKKSKGDSSHIRFNKNVEHKWNQDCYLKCCKMVADIAHHNKLDFNKTETLYLIEEIYNYSQINELTEPDFQFSQWLLMKNGRKE